ncbi:MAG: type I-U CRISPR-associated protein Csx17 [Thermaerobacter sp.]|nr:type I-U CRISPR-associated protein Csx17 [Thermaerobacter sp.]
MPDVVLSGCAPEPLASYLKAVGALRVVSRQMADDWRGCWRGEEFVLRGPGTAADLERFFLWDYRPMPVVAPWNGGSGFFREGNPTAAATLERMETSQSPRLARYREAIGQARALLVQAGVQRTTGKQKEKKPSKAEERQAKVRLLRLARAQLPEEALEWMDAAVLLAADQDRYPPLLGTGGNDGRLDFTVNFMQRLMDCFDPGSGRPAAQSAFWLRGSLYGEPVPGLLPGRAVGQFHPGMAGGANAGRGFEADSLANPWDFILMIEGAAAFAAAATRRLEHGPPGTFSYPFTVRMSGVGFTSAAASDEAEARGEIWLPLWKQPSTFAELRGLLSEGRAQVGARPARNGVDFARAVASLGTSRGLSGFRRFGFLKRNGKAFLASPLGRFRVEERPNMFLLQDLDGWLARLADGRDAPVGVREALRRVQDAILVVAQRGGQAAWCTLLVRLGELEAAVAANPGFRRERRMEPLTLRKREWVRCAEEDSPEFRLALALASTEGMRAHLEPVQVNKESVTWVKDAVRVVWREGDILGSLGAVFFRRLLERRESMKEGEALRGACPGLLIVSSAPGRAEGGGSPSAGYPASLADVGRFIQGDTDGRRLAALVRGLSLVVNWPVRREDGSTVAGVPASYLLLKLALSGGMVGKQLGGQREGVQQCIPLDPSVAARALGGDVPGACRLAVRRLRGAGLAPAVTALWEPVSTGRRVAAALAFPVGWGALAGQARLVLRRQEKEHQAG